MGWEIGGDAAKSGNKTRLVVVIRVRLSQNIGLLDLTNRTQFKKLNGYIIRTEIVYNHWGMSLMLHMWSIYYCHTHVNLLGVCPPPAPTCPNYDHIYLAISRCTTFFPGSFLGCVSDFARKLLTRVRTENYQQENTHNKASDV